MVLDMPDLNNLPLEGIRDISFESAPMKQGEGMHGDRPHFTNIRYWNGTEVKVPIHSKRQHDEFIDRIIKKSEAEGTSVYYIDNSDIEKMKANELD